MYIDCHCHLERETFGEQLDEVIARAFDAGVTHLVAVGSSGVTQGAREAIALAERLDRVYAAIGIHPHEASGARPEHLVQIETQLSHPKVVALGEIGLDYHYQHSPRHQQQKIFRQQLAAAKIRHVPVMLHVREAHADCLAIVDEVGLPERGGMIHCFTGDAREAQAYLERGFYLSIPGVITFNNADGLRAAVRQVPLERLLLETDCPYLAPVPHRGQRNEPAFIVHTAAALGQLFELSGEDIGRITSVNAQRFFGLKSQQQGALAYPIRNSLYVNITSRCTLACRFCPKVERRDWWVRGHWLRLRQEPDFDAIYAAVVAELKRRPELTEVVFVGLGEPTLRLDILLKLARHLRRRYEHQYSLRLDTDGLGNLVHGRDITPDLAALFDTVSVSLNAADAATYARLCPSKYGEAAFDAVKAFIRAARSAGVPVVASVVGVPGLDVEACQRLAEQELGVAFRHRVYQQYG